MQEPVDLVVSFEAAAGQGDALFAVLQALQAGSVQEPGCLAYDLARSDGNPDVFFLVEMWTSAQALQEHQRTPHFVEGVAAIGRLGAKVEQHAVHWTPRPLRG
ncbi:putative quinol monooxygenase [Bordetella genomosp. 1]|uniref:ABM domain-containing protein n=1 Tax=Bordetella genomosp. 1 TaxID=1395607 RepID=A0ABX4EV44_9BORD|nr:putative quinol monooxygenase [Bordetella genomosp. 1]MDQ8035346.1 putative quinol monooxygenase [Bordetella sp.]OZI58022.1 hypothetical protein CAL27_21810 [Bordetella genomosp. 1]